MSRQISKDGLKLIKQWESLRLKAYKDSGGIPTIGYGHIKGVKMGMVITEAEAEAFLREDLKDAENAVNKYVKVVLNDNQFGALVSFVFNVGGGAFQRSTLLKKLNAGNYDAVPKELMKWVTVKGTRVQGLVNRRSAEVGLWVKGSYVADATKTDPEPEKPTVNTEKKAGVAITGVAAASSAVQEVVVQATPLAEYSDIIKYGVVALLVVGLALTVWGIWKGKKEQEG